MLEEMINGQGAEGIEPEVAPIEVTTTPEVEQITEPTPEVTETTINEIDINGQKVSLDEVRQGYLRQQDYVTKQQQLDARLKEAEQSMQLVDYLRKNPHLAQRLYEDKEAQPVTQVVNPAMQEIENLKREMYQDKLNNTISSLKSKYNDFNEIEVMNRAVAMGVTDLEFVYNGMRGANLDTLVAQRVKEELAKATQQIQANANATKTLINGGQTTPQATVNHGLSAPEMRVADMMGLSYEEYAKYK